MTGAIPAFGGDVYAVSIRSIANDIRTRGIKDLAIPGFADGRGRFGVLTDCLRWWRRFSKVKCRFRDGSSEWVAGAEMTVRAGREVPLHCLSNRESRRYIASRPDDSRHSLTWPEGAAKRILAVGNAA